MFFTPLLQSSWRISTHGCNLSIIRGRRAPSFQVTHAYRYKFAYTDFSDEELARNVSWCRIKKHSSLLLVRSWWRDPLPLADELLDAPRAAAVLLAGGCERLLDVPEWKGAVGVLWRP